MIGKIDIKIGGTQQVTLHNQMFVLSLELFCSGLSLKSSVKGARFRRGSVPAPAEVGPRDNTIGIDHTPKFRK